MIRISEIEGDYCLYEFFKGEEDKYLGMYNSFNEGNDYSWSAYSAAPGYEMCEKPCKNKEECEAWILNTWGI